MPSPAQCALASEDRDIAEFRAALAAGRVIGAHCPRCGMVPSVTCDEYRCETCWSVTTACVGEVITAASVAAE